MQSQPRHASAKITRQSQWDKPIFITGEEEGVGENKYHFINTRNKSRKLQDVMKIHVSVGERNLDFSLGVIVDDVLYLSP